MTITPKEHTEIARMTNQIARICNADQHPAHCDFLTKAAIAAIANELEDQLSHWMANATIQRDKTDAPQQPALTGM